MNRRMLTLLVVAVFAAGCGSIESKKIDYKSAGKLPPLDIPPDLTQPSRDDRYAVPQLTARGSATYSEYANERSGTKNTAASPILPVADKVRLERAGSQRWLVVTVPSDDLWPMVKDFWQEMGFIINVENPSTGIMETDWAENRAKLPMDFLRETLGRAFDSLYSTSERDKFRTRLEQGTTPGTTEVYISHRGMEEVYADQTKDRTIWQPRPVDTEIEAEMLQRLMVRLGTDEGQAKRMLTEAPVTLRAKLEKTPAGASLLSLQEGFDRAWRRVGLSLDRVGFTVEDRDRAKGQYFVRYVDPELQNEAPNLFSSLAFWRDKKPEPHQQFRIDVQGEGAASTVRVMTLAGEADTSETAQKILNLLFEQLK